MEHKILFLPGDGIGVEVIDEAIKVCLTVESKFNIKLQMYHSTIGGAAIDKHGVPYPSEINDYLIKVDAILLGAVGGPKWDRNPRELRPETGLLQIRNQLKLFANLRPVISIPSLYSASSLKPELLVGLDILIVRELTGGLYFGKPRGNVNGEAFNTMRYNQHEIERIVKLAFSFAQSRSKKLCSVDKANVLEVSELWRDIVNQQATNFPEVRVQHMYVDNAAMQLVSNPSQFDVIVTENMFGDILSDCAAMLSGSLGMLPSASLNASNFGLYEPVHGSAPDIAGQGIANPMATILSLAMLFRFSLKLPIVADTIEQAVYKALELDYKTIDIADNNKAFSTNQVGDKICEIIKGENE